MVALALVVSLNGVGLLAVGDTVGFYFDSEHSNGNAFIAGNIDFTATSTEWNPLSVATSMSPGDATVTDFTLDPLVSNPFQYFVEATTTGDSAFCDGVGVTFSEGANTLYSGALSGLVTGTTTATTSLSLLATTGLANFQNQVCYADFTFNGWQTRHALPEMTGYSDTEIVSKKLASWGFRINKVYANATSSRYAPGTSTEAENEWVEVYNQTSVPLDLSGWELCDNEACDVLPSGIPLIPAEGYAVIVNDPGVFSATGTAPWYLPAGVVEVVLENPLGNGLANSADMLVLKRPDGVVVDQMNWGTPDTGLWGNYAPYADGVWNPGVLAAAKGNLLTRSPNGFDTDQPSDWVAIAPPTVDLIYPDEQGSYTWYWGYSYAITWTAINPNGPNGDLNISLFFIKDLDHTGTITTADTTHTIVGTTENDGAYSWTVPSGFIGYIWIKLVATGPENPLNNSRTISGLIYDPVPLFVGPLGVDPDDVDTEAPVITLFGNNPAVIARGSTYADLGAAVTDNVNTNLGYTTEGTVDTDTLGEYTITYSAIDQAGNAAAAVRTVVVYDPEVGVPPEYAVPEESSTPPDVPSSETGGSAAEAETETESALPPEEEDESADGGTEEGESEAPASPLESDPAALEEESEVAEMLVIEAVEGVGEESVSEEEGVGGETIIPEVEAVEEVPAEPTHETPESEEDIILFREEDGEVAGAVVEEGESGFEETATEETL